MRNKLLIILTALMLSCASVGLLTACGHTHEYSKVVTNPTCLEKGYTTYTCKCGDSYVADETPALGHNYGTQWVSNGDGTHSLVCANDSNHKKTQACFGGTATCASEAECSVCGGKYGEKLPHAWGDWAPVGDGTHKRVCANDETHVEIVECGGGNATCDDKAVCATCNGQYGDKLGHDWGEWVSLGGSHTRVCSRDASHVETFECSGGNATCDDKAVCATCKAEYGEKLGHAYPDVWTYIGEGKHQKVCGNDASHVLEQDCVFNKEVAEPKYLKAEATLSSKAQYYYSCECGAFGEEYFEIGEFAVAVNYDASTGELLTSVLNGKVIVSATFGDVELTEANGGIIKVGDKYTFRAKTSATDELAGVPFFAGANTKNIISARFTLDEGSIELKYVACWSVIIDTPEEFLSTLDNNVFGGVSATKNASIDKNIALANDLDMSGYTFVNTVGTTFNGYFNGNGNVISNLTVTSYNPNSGAGGIFGILAGYVKNVAFINVMGAGSRQLLSAPLATLIDYTCLKEDNNIENVYFHTAPDILDYFASGAIGRTHTQAKLRNFVIDIPCADQVIDETWMNTGMAWTNKGSFAANPSTLISGGFNSNNTYVISKMPLMYAKPNNATPNIADNPGKEYFVYGENETDVHFNFAYFATQLGAGVAPTVENTQVIDPATGKQVTDVTLSKTFVLNNIRRYNDYAAMAGDTSEKHLENLAEMEATGMWAIENNAPIFKGFYQRYHAYRYNTKLTVNGEEKSSVDLLQNGKITVDFTTEDANAEFVSLEANNDNVTISGKEITGIKHGDSIVTLTYKSGDVVTKLTLNVSVSKPITEIKEVVGYGANSGLLASSALTGKTIVKAKVNGEELTIANGGIIEKDGTYAFRAKTSATDELAGVPFVDMNSLASRVFTIDVETETDLYRFSNVQYFNIMITNQDEFIEALDADVYAAGTANGDASRSNENIIGLANDLDMTGYTFLNTKGSGFKGYFDGLGHVVSNLTVTGYNPNNGSGGIFGSLFGYVKNVAFTNVMGTGSKGLLSSPFASELPWNGLRNDNNIENVYIQTSATILDYFNAVGPRIDYRAKVVNYVIDAPVADQTIDETWMNTGTSWTGKGSLAPNPSSLITYGTKNFNNVYVISKMPLLYQKGSTPNLDSLGASADYFAYGENETKVHFNFTYFKTQLGEGVAPTVQNTQVIDPATGKQVTDTKASKTFVLENIRRYDDMTALAGDASDAHKANLAEMTETGMWKVVEGKLYWAKLAPQE